MKYHLLGKSGLRVSELALGAMSFGTEWGWGTERNEARKMLDLYVDNGGNFVDTANIYTNGSSETILGECLGEKRQQIVLSTKYTMNTHPGDPNGGGNHRKSMVRSVETSLQRLKTDYIDLLYLHIWDGTTPVEEIVRAMDDLVRAGKILYVGMSDTPAWQISRMQAIADLRGWSPLVALQIEYNLIERTTERELIPMANEMGLGVVPFSPLSNGLLSGKYSREDFLNKSGSTGFQGSRKNAIETLGKFTQRNMQIVDEVKKVASEVQKSPAEVALAWLRMTRLPTGRFLSQQILRARKRFFRPVGLRSRASFFLTSRIAKAAAMIFGAVVMTLWPLRAGRLSARRVAQRAGANAAFHARTHTRDYAE